MKACSFCFSVWKIRGFFFTFETTHSFTSFVHMWWRQVLLPQLKSCILYAFNGVFTQSLNCRLGFLLLRALSRNKFDHISPAYMQVSSVRDCHPNIVDIQSCIGHLPGFSCHFIHLYRDTITHFDWTSYKRLLCWNLVCYPIFYRDTNLHTPLTIYMDRLRPRIITKRHN